MSGRPARPAAAVTAVLAVALAAAAPSSVAGQVLMTQDEALEAAFPEATAVERKTAYLEDAELDEVRRLAGERTSVEQRVVTYYVARGEGGEPLGAAYFDAHRVRTKTEVAMLVVGPGDTLERVEVLRFDEPPEYMASEPWIEQLLGRPLDRRLSLRGDIVNMTGATLTAESLTTAARRTLALHRVIRPLEGSAAREPSHERREPSRPREDGEVRR